MKRKRIVTLSLLIPVILTLSCRSSAPKGASQSVETSDAVAKNAHQKATCEPVGEHTGAVYESWDDDSGLIHRYHHGIDIEPGRADDAKYLERHSASPWLAPEYITTEQAEGDDLKWAGGKSLRWLSGTMATLHFPFYPDDWQGDLYVELEMRPKVNPSGAIRFYAPDESGARSWSQPLTADFTPGWNGYRWRLPRELLANDGMQLLRVSFPGSYFEGDKRVSAKFVRIGITNEKRPLGRYDVGAFPTALRLAPMRTLSHPIDAYPLAQSHRIDRFFVVPDHAMLEFSAAPAPYLETAANLRVQIAIDGAKPIVHDIPIAPGACWIHHSIDLSEYAQKAVRISIVPDIPLNDDGFSTPTDPRPQISITPPKIIIDDGSTIANKIQHSNVNENDKPTPRGKHSLSSIRERIAPSRIVVIAVDNLRADRLTANSKRRATPALSKLYDEGISGVVMASGLSLATTVASFLTSLPPDAHGVATTGTHLRESLTTLPEAMREKQWHSEFFSTSSIADDSKGFAQGFDAVHALNKENVVSSQAVFDRVAEALKASQPKSLFFVHISELRLPYKAPSEKLELWAVPNYSGTVTPQSMQNLIVKQNPSAEDAKQLEAYYDGELSVVDDAIGAFAKKLPADTLVVLWGTHGNSLGETHLGYEQTLSPWELLSPYAFWMPNAHFNLPQTTIARPESISATILDIAQASAPAHAQSLFDPHDPRPQADSDTASATATRDYFYRIRREGVDILYTTGLDGQHAMTIDAPAPIARQALRERIE